MKSSNEHLFYDALGKVPEVPSGILNNVERYAKRSGTKRRMILAASLLLAFIVPALILTQFDIAVSSATLAYAESHEAMDELMYAFKFLSGSDTGNLCIGHLFDFDVEYGNDNALSQTHEDNREDEIILQEKEVTHEY